MSTNIKLFPFCFVFMFSSWTMGFGTCTEISLILRELVSTVVSDMCVCFSSLKILSEVKSLTRYNAAIILSKNY